MGSGRLVLGLVVLALVTTACAYFTGRLVAPYRPPAPLPPAEAAEPGRFLYARDCAWCHGGRGEGTPRGPVLAGVGAASADFYLATGRMPIERPDQPIRQGPPVYPPEQLEALVEYVAGLGEGGPLIPEVRPEQGDLAGGQELYQLNCAACHAPSGVGGAMAVGPDAPSLLAATPVQVAEAMRIGPGNMPVFGPESFGQEELDSIVRYVLYLQDPEDRGGWSLGRLGPVTEGLMVWVLGVVPLLVALVWITKRS